MVSENLAQMQIITQFQLVSLWREKRQRLTSGSYDTNPSYLLFSKSSAAQDLQFAVYISAY